MRLFISKLIGCLAGQAELLLKFKKKKKKQNGCFDIDQGRTNTHTYTRTNIEKLSPKIEKTLFDKLLHI